MSRARIEPDGRPEVRSRRPRAERSGSSILVVDDEPLMRGLLETVFDTEGYDVTVAPDGPTALVRAREGAFDAAVLDLMMPGMDGRTVLRCLKADPLTAGISVVVVSGGSASTFVEDLLLDGAAAFVAKPFRVSVLAEVVRAAIAAG